MGMMPHVARPRPNIDVNYDRWQLDIELVNQADPEDRHTARVAIKLSEIDGAAPINDQLVEPWTGRCDQLRDPIEFRLYRGDRLAAVAQDAPITTVEADGTKFDVFQLAIRE